MLLYIVEGRRVSMAAPVMALQAFKLVVGDITIDLSPDGTGTLHRYHQHLLTAHTLGGSPTSPP